MTASNDTTPFPVEAARKTRRIGIAAVYAPASKYKVFWALILAGPDGGRG